MGNSVVLVHRSMYMAHNEKKTFLRGGESRRYFCSPNIDVVSDVSQHLKRYQTTLSCGPSYSITTYLCSVKRMCRIVTDVLIQVDVPGVVEVHILHYCVQLTSHILFRCIFDHLVLNEPSDVLNVVITERAKHIVYRRSAFLLTSSEQAHKFEKYCASVNIRHGAIVGRRPPTVGSPHLFRCTFPDDTAESLPCLTTLDANRPRRQQLGDIRLEKRGESV